MKHWIYSIAPTIIIAFLIINFDSELGLLHTWVVIFFVIAVLASYYIPYQLVEGEVRSSFYAMLCCGMVLFCAYKFDQLHKSGLNSYKQEVCGVVANRKNDALTRKSRKREKLYRFDLLAGHQGIEHFRKKTHVPWDGKNVCVTYIDQKHSWLYAEHLIVDLRTP